MIGIEIGATRETLLKINQDLLVALSADSPGIDFTVYGKDETGRGEVVLHFSNDDMEGRDDVKDEILVEVDLDA